RVDVIKNHPAESSTHAATYRKACSEYTFKHREGCEQMSGKASGATLPDRRRVAGTDEVGSTNFAARCTTSGEINGCLHVLGGNHSRQHACEGNGINRSSAVGAVYDGPASLSPRNAGGHRPPPGV